MDRCHKKRSQPFQEGMASDGLQDHRLHYSAHAFNANLIAWTNPAIVYSFAWAAGSKPNPRSTSLVCELMVTSFVLCSDGPKSFTSDRPIAELVTVVQSIWPAAICWAI